MSKKMVDAKCPNCNKSLLVDEIEIDGEKTIHFVAYEYKGQTFDLYLSSIWNNFKSITVPEQNIKKGIRLKMFCPHCRQELKKFHDNCMCGGTIYQISSTRGLLGMVFFCNTKGCHWHKMSEGHIPNGKTPASP